jgi:hypothetical protein
VGSELATETSMVEDFHETMSEAGNAQATAFRDNFAFFIFNVTTKDIVSIADNFRIMKDTEWNRCAVKKVVDTINRPSN